MAGERSQQGGERWLLSSPEAISMEDAGSGLRLSAAAFGFATLAAIRLRASFAYCTVA
jgi:hypothetical protein